MKKSSTKTLSLFARGKELGFVITDAGQIVRYGVKTVRGHRSGLAYAKRVEKAIFPLLASIAPQGLIVMERNSNASKNGALCQAINQVSKTLKRKGYPLCLISLFEVKKKLCKSRKATYRELIEAIAERYPILMPLSVTHKPERAKYWQKSLIAMSMAYVAKNSSYF